MQLAGDLHHEIDVVGEELLARGPEVDRHPTDDHRMDPKRCGDRIQQRDDLERALDDVRTLGDLGQLGAQPAEIGLLVAAHEAEPTRWGGRSAGGSRRRRLGAGARGIGGNDQLWGSGGPDTLYGGNDNDELHGGDDSDDTAEGNSGADTIFGENGKDLLRGNAGEDTLRPRAQRHRLGRRRPRLDLRRRRRGRSHD